MAKTSKKKYGRWLLLSAIIILTALALGGNLNLFNVHRETVTLKLQILKLNEQVDSLSKEIVKLQSDTAYIERIAREKLGMAGKNEVLYKFAGDKQ
jgi:cell division protein FtsB